MRRDDSLVPEPGVTEGPELIDAAIASAAILNGHFALQGGAHGLKFFRFKEVGRDPQLTRRISASLVRLAGIVESRDLVVLSPESSGSLLGTALARHLGCPLALAAIDSRRRPLPFLLTGALPRRSRVLIANDVFTTGNSLEPLLAVAGAAESEVVGVAVFVALDRARFGEWLETHRLDGRALVHARWPTYPPGPTCPGCRAGLPLLPASDFN